MWPTTCQREQALALDPDFPYHAGQGGGLAPVDERQDLLLLERIWRCVLVWFVCLWGFVGFWGGGAFL